jgi:ABC-type multidrug transport system, permease component
MRTVQNYRGKSPRGLCVPTFQPAVQIRASDIDSKMNRGELLFVVEIPPNFQANILAQRKTGIQINVDATAVAQAGNGANHLKTAISNEVQNFLNARGISGGSPINLVVRADFNPNLRTAWFSAMTQVINQITLLTVILTGAALIREREQGTVEHLLVMPVVPRKLCWRRCWPMDSSFLSPRCCHCNSWCTGGSVRRSLGRFCCSCSERPSMHWWSRRWAYCWARSQQRWANSASWRCPF